MLLRNVAKQLKLYQRNILEEKVPQYLHRAVNHK